MLRSMTGFGRGENVHANRRYYAEVRTVNHRYLDISVKLPKHLYCLEERVIEHISRNISRGKVDVYIQVQELGEEGRCVALDSHLAGMYVDALMKIKEEFGLPDAPTLSLISKIPDVLRVEFKEVDEEGIWKGLKDALDEAVGYVVFMRGKEGENLRKDIASRCAVLEDILGKIECKSPDVVKYYRERLEKRMEELLGNGRVDEMRLSMEAAFFAERCDISEELVRLKSHIGQISRLLDSAAPAGRKLDFVVQELNREINTIASKANDAFITSLVIDFKSEIERMREQIQNIE